MVATDRISAYDWVLPTLIPDKGRVLTGLSAFWFRRLDAPNHLLSTDPDFAGLGLRPDTRAELEGRTMVVRKLDVVPFECVVRGYLAGSGWREYRASGTVCGEKLPAGLREGDRIPTVFTPATKAESGHDENVRLIDEALTPDSSRYWPEEGYHPGGPQPSFDKQYVRDWLDAFGWDKASPPPPLPEDVVARTRDKYIQAYEILTLQPFPWE
jgi:phosphoribosylaminoimidazole-succinocarboxamide synthase